MDDTGAAVEVAADELYGVTLEHFTERRNELAKALRKQGDKSAADAVKALRKPSQSAWALNQLARRDTEEVDRLLATGVELRRAQEAVLSGEDPRLLAAATQEERRVVSDLVAAASATVAEAGVGATEALRARVRSTLEAAVRDDEVGEALRAGRLVGDHQAVGLLDLSAWQPSPETPAGRAAPAEGRAKREKPKPKPKGEVSGRSREVAARQAAREKEAAERAERAERAEQAEQRLQAAREKEAAERAQRVDQAEQRLRAARRRRESAEEQLEDAAHEVSAARRRMEQALAEAERAEEAHRAIRTEHEEAGEEVRVLEEELAREKG